MNKREALISPALVPEILPPSAHLRAATRDRHRRIERARPLARLFAKDYTLDEYRACLARFHGFYKAIEPQLALVLADGANRVFLRPPKTPLLAEDLASLGLSPAEIERLPVCADLPPIGAVEEAVGVAYVLEGSTQGGMFIRKQLAAHFGPGAGNSMRFYTGYGERTESMWRDFKAALDGRFGSSPASLPALAESANGTFDALAGWLGGLDGG